MTIETPRIDQIRAFSRTPQYGTLPTMDSQETPAVKLGLPSGIGLVVANMIGVGILTSTGFMISGLSSGKIFLVWIIQGVLAICGARAYAGLAQINPRSGGEYRYLSDLLHPLLGYMAGWTSLLLGFSAPVAANAFAAGDFFRTIGLHADPRLIGTFVIVIITVFQALDLNASKWSQDVLVGLKVVLVVGFILLGLVKGSNHWPAYSPKGFPGVFVINLFFAAYAYSGWNSAIYVAGEFRDPRRDVPRAMVIGTVAVMIAYLAVSWVFVTNLSPDEISSAGGQITVAHLLAGKLIGKLAASIVSVGVIIVLISANSAMTLLGPRVYAAMARDGFLPKVLAGEENRPPMWSVFLQSAIALFLMFTNKFDVLLRNVGAILTLMSALTMLAVFRAQFGKTRFEKPGYVATGTAAVYVIASAWMFWKAFQLGQAAGSWIGVVCVVTIVAYLVTMVEKLSAEVESLKNKSP
jgi:APA family basic amino acid/polyamine antiporter